LASTGWAPLAALPPFGGPTLATRTHGRRRARRTRTGASQEHRSTRGQE
jgi:hypothetical protein